MNRWQQDAAISREAARRLEPPEERERNYHCHECDWEGTDPLDNGETCPKCGGEVTEDEYDPLNFDRPEDDF